MSFVDWIEGHRVQHGLTYTKVANKMEYDKAHLSRLRHRQKEPPRKEKVLRRIGAALDIPWQTLLFESLADRVVFGLGKTAFGSSLTRADMDQLQKTVVDSLRKYAVIL